MCVCVCRLQVRNQVIPLLCIYIYLSIYALIQLYISDTDTYYAGGTLCPCNVPYDITTCFLFIIKKIIEQPHKASITGLPPLNPSGSWSQYVSLLAAALIETMLLWGSVSCKNYSCDFICEIFPDNKGRSFIIVMLFFSLPSLQTHSQPIKGLSVEPHFKEKHPGCTCSWQQRGRVIIILKLDKRCKLS